MGSMGSIRPDDGFTKGASCNQDPTNKRLHE